MKHAITRIAKNLTWAVLAQPAMARLRRGRIAAARLLPILTFHRVAPHDGSAYPPLDPGLFDELLSYLTRHFRLRTFGDLAQPLEPGLPELILSFDDGYRDFIEVAAPLLARRGLRVNHNVIPACIESGRPPLNVLVQDFIGQAPERLLRELVIPGLASPGSWEQREQVGLRISRHLKNRPMAEQTQLLEALQPQLERLDGFRPTPMLTRAEVRQLAAHHELGAHSFAHASMGFETDAYFEQDLGKCQEYFRTQLERACTIYAFPNGSCRDSQLTAARAAGMEHVLLVGENFSRRELTCHPRFSMYGTSAPELRHRALGRLVPGA